MLIDSSLTDSGSISQSSLAVTELVGQRNPSSAKVLSECKHPEHRPVHMLDTDQPLDVRFQLKSSQGDGNECSAGFQINKEMPYIQPVKHPISCTLTSNPDKASMDKEDIRPLCPYDKKSSIPVDKSELEGLPFGSDNITKSRKIYGSIEHVGTNCLTILQKHGSFLCYSELKSKTELDLSTMDSKSQVLTSISSSPMKEDGFVNPQKEEMGQETEEGDVGELKIRYEDYQENKTEKTIVAQQEAHYKFFPSVILSNCLSRRKAGNKKPVDNQELSPSRRSKLKTSKKRLGMAGHRNKTKLSHDSTSTGTSNLTSSSLHSVTVETEELVDQPTVEAQSIGDEPMVIVKKEYDESRVNKPMEPASELLVSNSTIITASSEVPKDSKEQILSPDEDLAAKVTCTKPSALPGSKYSLRAKRKTVCDGEDGEHSGPTQSKISSSVKKRLKETNVAGGLHVKDQKKRKKEPPIIIKYIIINRFKGQKNMLVKISRMKSGEQSVQLTPDKLEQYNKLAPLKDFWPKVPESPAVEFPVIELKAKKTPKRKVKVNSTNKKTPQKGLNNTSKHWLKRGRGVKRAKGCQRGPVLPSLPPPRPCYCELTDDRDNDYKDVMVELGYLSDTSLSPAESTPPRCWSPSDPLMYSSSEQLINPLNDPCLSSAFHKPQKMSSTKGAQRRTPKPKKPPETKRKVRKSAAKPPETDKPQKENSKRCAATRWTKKVETKTGSPKTAGRPRRSRKKKTGEPEICDLSKDGSQLLFLENEPLPSEGSSQEVPPFQQPVDSEGISQAGSQPTPSSDSNSIAQIIKPKVEDCDTSIMEINQSLLGPSETKQQGCQTVVVKTEEESTPPLLSPASQASLEHTKDTKLPEVSPNSGPKNGETQPLPDTTSGLAVLKQLLQKRQQGQALPTQVVGTNSHATVVAKATALLSPTAKLPKSRKAPSTTPRKPRTPKSATPKDKKQEPRGKQNKKARISRSQPNPLPKQEGSFLDDCPLFLSDPEQDGCSCMEGSLSPELPHNYSFDINDISRTDFSSPYTGSQFVLTDKNLPVKFLSDISQEAVSAQTIGFEDLPQSQVSSQKGLEGDKSRPASPDLFDKFERRQSSSSLALLDSEKLKSRDWDGTSNKFSNRSPFQDFHCEREELLFSTLDPVPPLALSSASLVEHEGSPTSDLLDGLDGLTSTTPSSSPQSSSSSLSQARASQLQRATGGGAHILKPLMSPPSREEILSTLPDLELSEATFQEPFCSDPSDAPGKPM